MALINCRECNKEISDLAPSCPNCGAPQAAQQIAEVKQDKTASAPGSKPKRKMSGAEVIVTLALAGLMIWWFESGSSSNTKTDASGSKESAAEEKPCAKDDLSCLGNKGVVGAGVYCTPKVEKFALHAVKWKDGLLEMKFDHFRWKDQSTGIITYIGDKVEFQNGFGAFTPMTYECDMAPDNQTVLDVRVREGRL